MCTRSRPASRSSTTSCQRLAARSGRVRVRQLVHEDDCGPTCQSRVQVELFQCRAAVLHRTPQQGGKAFQQHFRLRSPMSLDVPGHDVHASGVEHARCLEHRVRLSHAGRRTEQDLQLAARAARLLPRASDELPGLAAQLSTPVDRGRSSVAPVVTTCSTTAARRSRTASNLGNSRGFAL